MSLQVLRIAQHLQTHPLLLKRWRHSRQKREKDSFVGVAHRATPTKLSKITRMGRGQSLRKDF